MTTDELRGNVEAGLRLLLKSEKPLYRQAAEVGITDLREMTKRAEEANTLSHAIQRYADTLILDQPLDRVAPLSRAIVAHDLRAFLLAEDGAESSTHGRERPV